ncbi:mitochondrial fission regulator 2 isoform X2 [Gouania willdenowi]|uniref:mitochondrial fission regulator 2 isoform X2 n=1 Tax=Gouania willdenowi TaxID=441366 RepID=UPI001056546F|nr:mitochondrial fission regulator 2 isoform X2 [Gouania willdenowi]
MSLVEDFVEVLHMVLDYFGVPPEMLVPVWDSQLCGQYRSIVRMIGTNLPLTPTPRVHFEIPLLSYRMHRYVDVTMEASAIPSFADVMWVLEDECDDSARTRNRLSSNKLSALDQDVRRCSARPPAQVQRGRSMKQITDPNALKKITALESELLKLRAQIAMIVTTPVSPSPLTSTPRCPAPPPPPPPPLPPPIPTSSSEILSVAELIRQRRKNENNLGKGQLKPRDSRPGRGSHNKEIPSMLDVLKDLNQVKLRSVKRSPGGTPVKKRRSKGGTALLNDPAALIAEALKRKFSLYRHNNSSDKENSLELSPFGSPDTPKVPQHVRRSQGRRHF